MATAAVTVALRVRPLIHANQDGCSITFVKDEPRIIIGNERYFTFDFVFPPKTSQQELYDHSILPLVDRFIEGKNVAILAFGQNGSGKTYSLGTGTGQSNQQGIIPRFAHSLFKRAAELQSNTFQIYASFLELYNEDIHDLLISTEMTHQQKDHATIIEDIDGKIHWTGVKEQRIYTAKDLMRCLQNGSQKRRACSSSHAIFSIILTQQAVNYDTDTAAADTSMLVENMGVAPQSLVSKFYFVDFAGSERLEQSSAMKDRQKEINGGLLPLDRVLSALGDNKKSGSKWPGHVPHKDGKLTSLLQDSLGGNSHTLMLACVSASSSDYTETLNTLEYANRARNIRNRVPVNQESLNPSRLESQSQTLKDDDHHDGTTERYSGQDTQDIEPFSRQWSIDLAQGISDRDTPFLGKDAYQAQHLRPPLAETCNSSTGRDFSSRLQSLQPQRPKVSSSMGFFDKKNLFVDSNITKKQQGSVSSSRRLTSKKKPVIQRMKTQSSPALKRRPTHENMDELLALLREEYYGDDGRFKRICKLVYILVTTVNI
ncbi:P-loop containing nucleoside triphosphate hydrolase protein [Parasitella parasitica]|nr:P-loop containing nucleoside triphosphate hydrolase protein [Parasitella parasitica]